MKLKMLGLWVIFLGLMGGIFYFAVEVLDKPTYRVRFDTNGGSKVESIQVREEETLDNLPKSTKAGYQFVGWYLNDLEYDLSVPVSEDITLKAVWRLADNPKYIVRFDSLGGSAVEELEVLEGEVLQNIPTPEKDGYQFVAWYYHNKEFDFSKGVKDNMTLVAKWKYIGD